MRLLVTAGPTREYIDPVRYVSNASSGRMGYAVASAAVRGGHRVTLLSGPVCRPAPAGAALLAFRDFQELSDGLAAHFEQCDVLVMAAAVADFQVADRRSRKIPRSGGPVRIALEPTEDLAARCGSNKTDAQRIVVFAVEDGTAAEREQKALEEMAAKHADFSVVNTPAAIDSETSEACILDAGGVVVPWAVRPKPELAREILKLLEKTGQNVR